MSDQSSSRQILPLPVPAHHHDRIARDAIVQVVPGIGNAIGALSSECAGRAEFRVCLQLGESVRDTRLNQGGGANILRGDACQSCFVRSPRGARPLKPLFCAFRHAQIR